MSISGIQFQALLDALKKSFTEVRQMRMLLIQNNKNLDDYAREGDREEVYTKLIDGARRDRWLRLFVRAARDARPNVPELKSLGREIEFMTPEWERLGDLSERFIAIIDEAAIPRGELMAAYRFCAPAGWERDLDDFRAAHLAAVIVYHLADYISPDRSPLIELALHLGPKIQDRKLSVALDEWVTSACKFLDIDEPSRDAMAARARTGKEPHDLYLLIAAERHTRPHGDRGPVLYRVESWRHKVFRKKRPEHDRVEESAYGLVESCSEEELKALVVKLIAELDEEKAREEAESFFVEMFLEHHTLSLNVDQWDNHAPDPWPIGADCRFVLRSFDRVFRSHFSVPRLWRERWQAHGRQAKAHRCDEEFFRQKTCGPRMAAENISCVILDFVPTAEDYDAKGRISAMLRGGTPMAIWTRSSIGEALFGNFRTLAETLVADAKDWRDVIYQVRLDAASTTLDHLGRYLCLLYDDPERVPMERTLEAS